MPEIREQNLRLEIRQISPAVPRNKAIGLVCHCDQLVGSIDVGSSCDNAAKRHNVASNRLGRPSVVLPI